MSWWREQVIKCKKFYHFAIGRLNPLVQVFYSDTLWHEMFAGSNFCDFSSDPQK